MVKSLLRPWKFRAACVPWRLLAAGGLWRGAGAPVQFVAENADWSIRWDGDHICEQVNRLTGASTAEVTTDPSRCVERVVHFGSQYMWLDWGRHMPRTNRFVATFFHGKAEDGPEVAQHIDAFLASVPRLAKVVTAASLIEQRLLNWGVPREKLERIPIGVDSATFTPPTAAERAAARRRFALPPDRIVVGSFQKDGVGWGDGNEPKLIKGPDVFLAAIAAVAKSVPVTAFLTGPARGYVKRGLERLGIPFVHTYVKTHAELATCYHALDLYFVTSREEGGPKGISEGMASGVPVVSTRVGMAQDLIVDGVSGGLVESEDAEGIAQSALKLLALPDGAGALRAAARAAAEEVDWSVVGRDHWLKVYRPLLGERGCARG